jgi:hypothetical protein
VRGSSDLSLFFFGCTLLLLFCSVSPISNNKTQKKTKSKRSNEKNKKTTQSSVLPHSFLVLWCGQVLGSSYAFTRALARLALCFD